MGDNVSGTYSVFHGDQQLESHTFSLTLGEGDFPEVVEALLAEMKGGEEEKKELQCKEVYGPFGCPSLGLRPQDEIVIVVKLEKRQNVEKEERDLKKEAEERKAKGTAFFKKALYGEARAEYFGAITILEEGHVEALELLVSLYGNIGVCEMKMKNWSALLSSSLWIVEHATSNQQLGKAHYRIGEVLRESKCAKAALWHYEKSHEYHNSQDAMNRITWIQDFLQKKEEQNVGKVVTGFFGSSQSLSM
eukprot:TRINITY_DN15512_c0_g1_i1.p1 TRINITY_DN15512_c0_g1~~TRINITY_DN15512_c0_g1_i1.p1  ORF type:complete len:248 (+),score=63.52 TRINITY_DN15512_c0_g1_i1:190-933(+)